MYLSAEKLLIQEKLLDNTKNKDMTRKPTCFSERFYANVMLKNLQW